MNVFGKRRVSPLTLVAVGVVVAALPITLFRGLNDRAGTSTGNGTPPAGMPTWLDVSFTNPNPPDQTDKGIDRGVVQTLNGAKKTIDVASFDLNLPSVVNALVAAKKRGVAVRVVVDETNGQQMLKASDVNGGQDFDALATFKGAGIPVVDGGRSNGLMHNKFILVDGTTLYEGSWNMSYNDTFRNNNNLQRITNATLIANYQAKFDELFVQKRFGTKAQVGAKTPTMTIDGVRVENYFSPVDHVMDKLIAQVNGAKKSVKFMAFTYTDTDLAAAMAARMKAGVDVRGVIENRGASQGALPSLFCAKVPVKTDGNKYTMHHKVIVIDDETVITGSFNFTNTADTANDDNVLILHSPAVAQLYSQEFDRVYGAGTTPSTVNCSTVKPVPQGTASGEG